MSHPLEHMLRRKNIRATAGLLPPPRPTHAALTREAPIDLGGRLGAFAYGLHRDPSGNRSLLRRSVRMPLADLLDLGLAPASQSCLTLESAASMPLVKVGPNLWLERSPQFTCALRGELTLGDVVIPVTERLSVTAGELWYLPLDGRPRRVDRDEALERFAEGDAYSSAATHSNWPPPLPPVAVLLRSDGDLDRQTDAALSSLITCPHIALQSATACVDTTALTDVVVIRSTAVHKHITLRTSRGVFHPRREPVETMTAGRDRPTIVFGLNAQVWSTVAHLHKGDL